MSHTKGLVLAEEKTALQVFSSDGGLDPIIQEAKDFVANFDHDLSTGAGRKRTISLSAKVATLKVKLDDMGKEVVAGAKAQVKAVDASRKAMRDTLDELKVEARKPVTDWEEEDARIREETRLKIEAKRLAEQLEADQEMALLMNANIDREAKEAADEAERQRQAEAGRLEQNRIEREARLQQEAADNARAEAERKAQADRDRIEQDRRDALRREQEAIDQAAQADRDRINAKDQAIRAEHARIEAEQRAKQQEQERIRVEAQAKETARVNAEQAEINRKKAEQQAEINRNAAAEQARQQEIQRQQAEKDRIQREQEQREADTKHKGAINRQAVAELMEWAGLTEDQAKATVKAIAKRQISSVTINY